MTTHPRLRRFRIAAFATIFFALGGSVSAATFTPTTTTDVPISSAAVVNASGQITNQGNAITLRSAVVAANAAGGTNTITLPAGTYQLTIAGTDASNAPDATIGDLDVLSPATAPNRNTLTIQGVSAATTIIQQTTADRVFDLHPGLSASFLGSLTFNLSNVTVKGGNLGTSSGGAILAGRAGDITSLTNCIFDGNTSPNNGGAISQSSASVSHDLTITNCVFTNNTTTNGFGGAVSYQGQGTVTITNSSFSNNTSGNYGGAVSVTGNTPGGTYNISTSSFVGNSANGVIYGGAAIAVVNGSTLRANFNRFTGNTAASIASGKTISTGGGTVTTFDANNNWWGVNTGPAASDVLGTAPTVWLQLRNSASPGSVSVGNASTVSADIFGLSSGGATLASNLTGLPTFPASGSAFGNAQKGTIPGASVQFVDGAAGVVFTANAAGPGGVDATADGQTVTASITVTGTPVLSTVNPGTGQQGQTLASVALTGQFTHFVQGTSTASFGAGITVNSLTVSSATAATANITIDPAASIGNRNVTVTTGGEVVTLTNGFAVTAGTPVLSTVNPGTGQQGQTLASVALTGQFTHFVQGTSTASFGAGITVNSLTVSSATAATANITIDAAASIGNRNVTVTTGGEVVTLTNGFAVTAGTPVLSTVNPNSGQQGQTLASVALTGQFTHFVQGTSTASFGAGITVNSLTVSSATAATANITIDPAASIGNRNVTVTTGGEVVTLTNGFAVTAGTPLLSTVNPGTGQQGQTLASVALTGQFTHFVQGTSTASFGAGITVNSLTVSSATAATANISVDPAASLGNRNVTVTTGGEVVTLTNGFAVTAGTPVLSTVNPNSGQQGQTLASVALTGQFTHFVQGTSTASFGAGITVNSLTVSSSTAATANITIDPAATIGNRNVTVTTGGEVVTLTNGFAVTAGTPLLSTVNPGTGQQGQTLASVALTGQFTHFVQGTSTASFGAGITVNSLTVSSATAATANITIDPAATIGNRNVTVTTGGEVVTLTNGFAVTAGTPVLSTVNPNSGQQGQTLASVALTGQFTHFVQGTSTASFGAGITVNSLTVSSATAATANITIDPAASIGNRNVTVTTGGEVVTLTNGFAVTAGTPVLSTVNPNSGQQGQTLASVALTGQFTHFVQGTSTASFGAGITVNSLTVSSATAATANITIDAAASIGNRNVTVTTGGEVVTLTNGFAVTAGTPVLSTVNPNSGQQGQTLASVALTGQFTHFVQGTSTASFGAGITVNSLTVSSATAATANITIDPAASIGNRNVTVTTGGEVVTLTNGFAVTAGTPVLSTVNPNSGQQGQTLASVALTGQFTHFVQGTSTASFGAGITVNSLTVSSATAATANITIDPAASIGNRNVTVTTGGEVVTLTNGFAVTAGTPVLSTVNPNSGQQGQTLASVALTGQFTHFVQGTSTASFGTGITVNSLTVSSPTAATANITIDPAASIGNRNVTVTTGGEVVTLTNGFAVTAGTPVLSTVNPGNGQQGQTLASVALTGQFTHFVQGTSTASFGAGITVNSLTVSSATAATVNITIDPAATIGNRNVSVTTGGEVVTLTGGFVVNSPGSTYTVSFNTNGGSAVPAQSVAPNGKATLPNPAPTKVGSVFVGWYSDAALSAPYDFSTPITADTILYAKWSLVSFSGPSPTGSGTITASFTGGGAGCGYATAQFIALAGNVASPPLGGLPGNVSFPHGLFDFSISGCTPGSVLAFTITYPDPLPVNALYWKYGPTPGGGANGTPHWYVLPALISGNTVTFSITDGGLGDDDLAANGSISDQGGPGVALPPLPIPTTSAWLLALLTLSLLGLGMRKRKPEAS